MKKILLDFLECPVCHRDFKLRVQEMDGGEVMQGWLDCACGAFVVKDGVPRLLPADIHPTNWSTAKRFGEEWNQFPDITPEHKEQFLSWINPVDRLHFAGKTVLDIGCGKGRHVRQAKHFSAGTVIGVDLSHAVDAAFWNVGRLDGVHIIQADIYHLPLKPRFDYAYAIGVLHHTPYPKRAFLCMVDKLKPGGTVSTWVYGREGNGWIVYLVNPIRRVTSRIWLPLTKAFSFGVAIILQAILKILYSPAARMPKRAWLRRHLPYRDYLYSIAGYSFRENFSIVFDHLLPEIAFYLRKEEFQDWFESARLQNIKISRRYSNSWRGFAQKPMGVLNGSSSRSSDPARIKVFRNALEAGKWAPGAVIAIGSFEALHLGHQKVIGSAVARARALKTRCLVLSFDPLPKEYFNPAYRPLLTLKRKAELLEEMGVDGLVLLPFDGNLACQAPDAFVRDVLIGQLTASDVWVGEDFCFGSARSGRVHTLEALGRYLGFSVHPVPLLDSGGEKISSSRIRDLLQAGRRSEAAELLGRPLEKD